jgi:3-hydroxybutyryl-CoA dehydratase
MSTASGYCIEDLDDGMYAVYRKMITHADISGFADISGDTNPVHLDEAYAASTRFRTRIAHGMLSAAFISAVVGTKLPGPGCVYLSQSLRFLAPVRIGDTVEAIATVAAVDRRRFRVALDTVCRVGETEVIVGEALLMVPSRSV